MYKSRKVRWIHMLRWATLATLETILLPASALAADDFYTCGFEVGTVMSTLLDMNVDTVAMQRELSTNVDIRKARKGDYIFFRNGRQWNCPDGISGVVTGTGPDVIQFRVGVKQGEQTLYLPSAAGRNGNEWYRLGPEIHTLFDSRR